MIFDVTPQFRAAKIAEIDRVFFFTLLAVNHLMSGDVRKHSFNKITAIRAGDVPQGQVFCFHLGNLQLAHDFRGNVVLLMIGSDLIHGRSPAFLNPISPVMYSEISCFLKIPNSLSRIWNAENDTPIASAISRTSSLSSARKILSP